MSQAKSGDTVKIHYTGTLDDGTEFDSSKGRDPLEFELGKGQVISGFEKSVEGMEVGDSKNVKLKPEEAYGPRHDQLIQDLPRSSLPAEIEPAVGMKLHSQTSDGRRIPLMVTAVTEESITVDANHELAGENLNFEIELVAIA